MIHCIGDSHSSIFSGKQEMQPVWPERSNDILPYFRSYRIGPATAYNLFNKIPIIDQIVTTQVNKENDTIVFCFGEVDIRAHLIKQAMQRFNKSVYDIIQECIDRYIDVIFYYRNQGYKVAVWSPIASFSDDKPYKGPFFGDNLIRNYYTLGFISFLTKSLAGTDVKVLHIFEKMLLEDGRTNPDYLDDWEDCHIHLSLNALPLIIEEFTDKGLI